ncbi:MAG: hypothetical protein EB015_23125, partial [Methylocystaceae bacterium]|nr:hypothetical protein [Methylocystaceae bacterium]
APKLSLSPRFQELTQQVVNQRYYQYCRVGYDFRDIEILADGKINAGHGAIEHTWSLVGTDEEPRLAFWDGGNILAELTLGRNGILHGKWLMHEQMPIVLLPISEDTRAAKHLPASLAGLRKPRLQNVVQINPGRQSLTIVMTGFKGQLHEELAKESVPRMQAYANKFGHDFAICNVDGNRPASWFKVAGLYQALQEYERALWIDSDVAIVRDDKDIFAEHIPTAWQAIVEHHADIGSVPNCGVWLVTRAMLPVLESMWTSEQFIAHGWWEQAALLQRLGYTPDVNKTTQSGSTLLLEKTQFLSATWNHHPRHLENVPDPHFKHITCYDDRLAELKRVLSA